MPKRKLTEQQVTEILTARLYEKPRPSCATLSRRFQVTQDTIFRICARTSWQHVALPNPPVESIDAEAEKI
jgi:hypothetical protein